MESQKNLIRTLWNPTNLDEPRGTLQNHVEPVSDMNIDQLRAILGRGLVIPAHPLALDVDGRFDERHQRALTRYYAAAGAGGVAVGVHTTQFVIRDSDIGLFEPVLSIAREEMDRADRLRPSAPLVRIGGICGPTSEALAEAAVLVDQRYHAGLLSLAALRDATDDQLIDHCEELAAAIPIIGFYLQRTVGGRPLEYPFWRRFVEIPRVVGIKIAPFNRYETLDVVRALADAKREDVSLYTGNDDNIVGDLITPFRFAVDDRAAERRIVGGLLGHWAVWTTSAAKMLEDCHLAVTTGRVPLTLLRLAAQVTDANGAFFDASNGFAGCIAGINEVLRRQGLMTSARCLDPHETLSRGQAEQIDRVSRAYPHLRDDDFVAAHLDEWLRP